MTGKNLTHWKKCYLNHHESAAVFGNNDSCWEEWFHVQKCVLTSSKWFQTRCCPDRPCTGSKAARTHALTWSYTLPNLKLHTTWSTEAAACQQHPWGLAAASFCQWLFFFFLFFFDALCNWEQKTAVRGQLLCCPRAGVFAQLKRVPPLEKQWINVIQKCLYWLFVLLQVHPGAP